MIINIIIIVIQYHPMMTIVKVKMMIQVTKNLSNHIVHPFVQLEWYFLNGSGVGVVGGVGGFNHYVRKSGILYMQEGYCKE